MHLDLDCITFGIVEQSVEKSHGGAAMYVKLPKKVDLAISNVFGMIQLNIFFSGAWKSCRKIAQSSRKGDKWRPWPKSDFWLMIWGSKWKKEIILCKWCSGAVIFEYRPLPPCHPCVTQWTHKIIYALKSYWTTGAE